VALPDFSTFGRGPDVSVFGRVGLATAVMTLFAIMLSDFFDTMGTVIGVGGEGGWLDAQGKLPRMRRVLLVDSLGALFGGIASAISATTSIESAAGVAAGGRTGATSVVTGCSFFLALFCSSPAAVVPPQATAGALMVVGYLLCGLDRDIPFGDFEKGLQAPAIIVTMPPTYSITKGIGAGLVSLAFIETERGKPRDIHPILLGTALAFLVYFAEPLILRFARGE
jgi:AGZA family xanthine/uracil permease-like MFS transporter